MKNQVAKWKNCRKGTCRLPWSDFILPGLECQDSLQRWWQRRKEPRCWDWRRAHQECAGFTTVPSGARSICETIAGSSLAKEKACFKVHKGRGAIACFAEPWSYTENWMSQKRKSSQESANCQIKIIIGKSKRNLLTAPKSEILRYEYRGDLPGNYTSWRDNLNHKQ